MLRRKNRRVFCESLEARHLLTGTLRGQVFEDVSGDGVRQADQGESGLNGFRVHLDLNGNGELDQTTQEFRRPGNPVDLAENGTRSVSFTVDAPGRYIADLDVRLTIDNFFNDPLNVELRSPSGQTLNLFASPDVDPRDVTLNDEAVADFMRAEDITGEMKPRAPLSIFDGLEASGQWRLSVRQTGGFVAPTLELWSLILTTTDEPLGYSDGEGAYSMEDVEAGEYTVLASAPDSWEVRPETTRVDVTIAEGETTTADIPTTPVTPRLSGRIWNDANGNQVADENESGLPGWTVYLDANDNGVLDEEETQVQTLADDPETLDTDEAGTYLFTDLEPGSYNVQHVVPDGWTSYPLVTEDLPFERYANRFSNELYRLTATDGVRRVARLDSPSLTEFDYLTQDELFYGLTGPNLVTFTPNSDDVTVVGPVTWNDDPITLTGIAASPDGRLFGIGPSGFFAMDRRSGRAERISEDTTIAQIDFIADGLLVGYQIASEAGPRFVSLDEASGEVIDVLASDVNIRFANGMDITPAGEVMFTTSQETQYFTLDGQLLRKFEQSQSLRGAGSIAAAQWQGVPVSVENAPDRVDFAAILPVSVSGRLTLSNSDGSTSGLGDVRIYLDQNDNGQFDIGEPDTLTQAHDPNMSDDFTGSYRFDNLPAGTVTVRQEIPFNLDQAAPESGIEVTLVSGEETTDVDFQNTLGQTFSGYVFLDEDGSGSEEDLEPRLSEITVFLDLDDNEILDDGEPVTTTNDAGEFSFGPLTSKDYTMRQILPHGWIATQPSDHQPRPVTFPRNAEEPIVFGQVRGGVITGRVFQDVRGDGIASPFDRTISRAAVFLDANGNGTLDEGELSTQTDANGYRFDTLPAGSYAVVAESVPGYEASTASVRTLEIGYDQEIPQVDFGMTPLPGTISGFRWLDSNGNGRREAGEPGLAGIGVFLDLNGDGQLGPDEPSVNTREDDPATPELDESGYYEFSQVSPGRYTVREVFDGDYIQTFPATENRQTLEDRIFAVDTTLGLIEELDETGSVVDSLPVPGELGRFATVYIAAGSDSLYFVNASNTPNVLWEIDPISGAVLDSDELPERVRGMSFANGLIYLYVSGRLLSFDGSTDTLTEVATGSYFGSDIDVLNAELVEGQGPQVPETIVQYSGSDLVLANLDGSGRSFRDVNTGFRSIQAIGSNGDEIWTLVRNGILEFDREGIFLREITIDFSSEYRDIAVGRAPVVDSDQYEVVVRPGESIRELNFGNLEQPRERAFGIAWLDENGNGLRNPGELGAGEIDIIFQNMNASSDRITTSADSPATPNRDEGGQFSTQLLPGSYRMSLEQDGQQLDITNSFSTVGDLATAGQVYQLVLDDAGSLAIEHRDLAQNLMRSFAVPDVPLFVGPQSLALDGDELVYVDGSDGRHARIWRLDSQSGQVLDFQVLESTEVVTASAATYDQQLVLGGDGNALLQVETGETIEIAMDFVGGAAWDPNTNSLVLVGSQGGEVKFARGTVDGRFTYFDAPAEALTGGIAVVNGQLLVPESEGTTVLGRYDLNTFERLGEVTWSQSEQIIAMTSNTSFANSRYFTVTAGVDTPGLSLGVSDTSTTNVQGDANGDGVVSAADAEAIHAAILGEVALEPAFDVDANGRVNAIDINSVASLMGAIVGDVDLNGTVEFADFLVMSANFGKDVECGWLDGDADGNGRVEFADFLVLSSNFGKRQ